MPRAAKWVPGAVKYISFSISVGKHSLHSEVLNNRASVSISNQGTLLVSVDLANRRSQNYLKEKFFTVTRNTWGMFI